MGKPAARMGDMTVHGGTIVAGLPTVLIGGQPAARVGDMHACPMVTPGVPPIPHVGGPVLPPGAAVVLIGGQPAACVGDMCTCTGPPDSVAPPGCPTVLIGQGGGGGGGGGGAGSGGATAAAAPESGTGGAPGDVSETEAPEDHYLDVTFTDKGGFPITGVGYSVKAPDGSVTDAMLAGRIRRTGVPTGNHEITLKAISNAQWSVESARVGDSVTLSAQTSGIDSGTPAKIAIYVNDFNSPDRVLRELEAEVQNDTIEIDWTLEVDRDLLAIQDSQTSRAGYSAPRYYFVVEAAGCQARSRFLRYRDWIEIRLKDADGNALGNRRYRLYLPNGEIREGTLDSQGTAREDNLPPGRVRVSFDMNS